MMLDRKFLKIYFCYFIKKNFFNFRIFFNFYLKKEFGFRKSFLGYLNVKIFMKLIIN